MLRRAGSFESSDRSLFVKTVKARQDYRFDVPCFGLRTLETLREAKIGAAALEAGRVIMLEKARRAGLGPGLGHQSPRLLTRHRAACALGGPRRIGCAMQKDLVTVIVKGVIPAVNSWALFLGNEEKTFVIYIDSLRRQGDQNDARPR